MKYHKYTYGYTELPMARQIKLYIVPLAVFRIYLEEFITVFGVGVGLHTIGLGTSAWSVLGICQPQKSQKNKAPHGY